jgi:cell division protein FtsW (lipid II flippase)
MDKISQYLQIIDLSLLAILGLMVIFSKSIRQNFIDSFKVTEGGFSARKLSGFAAFSIAIILSLQIKDEKIKESVIFSWQVVGTLCLSIVTAGQALSFWLRKPEEKSEEAKN